MHRTQAETPEVTCTGMNALADVVPFENPGALTEHDALDRFEDALIEAYPGLDIEELVTHRFAGGVYVREMFIPAGTCVVSMVHKGECISTCSSGAIWVWTAGTGEGFKLVEAPFTAETAPGTRRVGIAERDTVWTTYHATDSTEVEEVEKEMYEEGSLVRRKELSDRVKKLNELRAGIPRAIKAMSRGDLTKCLEQ